MNVFNALTKIPQVISAAQDLASRLQNLHDDPKFKALIASDPVIKAQSDRISQDARTIQEALR